MSDHRVNAGPIQPQGVGEDPLFYFTQVFVRFLQSIFGSFEKGSYKWLDGEDTDIVIADQGQYARVVAEKRPAIICMRGPASWSNVSMDQLKGFDINTGVRSHTDLISCTMVYQCLAPEGLEAQRVAWIACYLTRALKRHLLRAGLHRVGENIEVGAETDAEHGTPDSKPSSILVPVTVPFFFQDSWEVAPVDNLLLKALDLKLTSEANYPAPEGKPALRDPGMRGRVLKYDKTISLTQRAPLTSSTRTLKK